MRTEKKSDSILEVLTKELNLSLPDKIKIFELNLDQLSFDNFCDFFAVSTAQEVLNTIKTPSKHYDIAKFVYHSNCPHKSYNYSGMGYLV